MNVTEHDIQWGVTDAAAQSIDMDTTLTEIIGTLQSYVVMTRDQAIAVALWIVHTHSFEAAVTTPYINVNSAAKRSGKTTLLELLALLVRRPWLTGRISAAVLVRKTDKERPTLLLDESDAMFAGEKEYAEALRGILNTGFKSSGKTSLCIGQGANITYKDFYTFSPKAIAGIGKLPDTIADRSIVITLKRRARTETVCRFRERVVREHVDPIRCQIEAWAAANLSTLRGSTPELPDELGDRQQDVWEPLLAIADHVGGEWPSLARRAAVVLSGDVADDDDIGVQLLTDCKTVIADEREIHSKTLTEQLVALEDRPWGAWASGRPITQAKVARLLSGFGIHSFQIRVGGRNAKGYSRHQFEDAWERYLSPNPASKAKHGNNTNKYRPESAFSEAKHEESVSDSKTQEDPIDTGLRFGVSLSAPEPDTDEEEGVDL